MPTPHSQPDSKAGPTPKPAPNSAPNANQRRPAIWENPQIRYPLLVLVYLVVVGSLFNAFYAELRPLLASLEEFTAKTVYALMGVFSDQMKTRGNLVTYSGFSVSIIIECVGLLEMLIYSACVLAFPAAWSARLWGVPLGCFAIFAFNILRIVTLLLVGRHWNEAFDFFHVYFWQATLIAMIVSVLYGWIRLFVPRSEPTANAAASAPSAAT
ncbi:MAG: archaeosortase/exosortase family protein [Myxococcota bacterium]